MSAGVEIHGSCAPAFAVVDDVFVIYLLIVRRVGHHSYYLRRETVFDVEACF